MHNEELSVANKLFELLLNVGIRFEPIVRSGTASAAPGMQYVPHGCLLRGALFPHNFGTEALDDVVPDRFVSLDQEFLAERYENFLRH